MIIYLILGLIIIGLIISLIIVANRKSKINKAELELLFQEKRDLNHNIEYLKTDILNLENKNKELKDTLFLLQNEVGKKEEQNNILKEQEKEVQQKITELQNTANTVYDTALKTAQDKFDLQIENLSQDYQKNEEKYKEEYLTTLAELTEEFDQKIADRTQAIKILTDTFNRLKSVVTAAILEQKRRELDSSERELYQLQLSEADLKEIQKIRDILSYMRNERPLCKAIWESYYRNPCNELISRIIDKTKSCGIYKITNLINQKTYIGQAVNLSDRIRTHVKAGLGIDTPNSILYKAMRKDGVENFSFEILEYCDPVDLNDREKIWIGYFSSQEWGYNMTGGGSVSRKGENNA